MRISINNFKGRDVKAIWIGDLRQDTSHQWRIRVGINENGNYSSEDVPVGLLPILRIGGFYKDGILVPRERNKSEKAVVLGEKSFIGIEKSIDVCRNFNYYLYRDGEMMQQNIFVFEVNGIKYYFPSVEFIRSLYAFTTSLSNAMVRPNGLSMFISDFKINHGILSIDFTSEIAVKALMSDDFIFRIAWLLSHKDYFDSYQSIYTSLVKNLHIKSSAPLQCAIPKLHDIEFMFYGIENQNGVLILEVSRIKLDLRLQEIQYHHPLFQEKELNAESKKRGFRDFVEKYELHNATPKEDVNRPIITSEPINITFNQKPEVVKLTRGQRTGDTTGLISSNNHGRGGIILPSGVDESIRGGKLQPVELNAQEIEEPMMLTSGFEDFQQMVVQLRKRHSDLKCRLEFRYFPKTGRFSVLSDGNQRRCAVLKIEADYASTIVFEADLSDGHSLTTLLLYAKKNFREQEINRILRDMVDNNGYWNEDELVAFKYKKLKHTHKSAIHWAEKIYCTVFMM